MKKTSLFFGMLMLIFCLISQHTQSQGLLSPKTIPFHENFDGETVPALPEGWSALDLNSDTHVWKTTNNSTYVKSSPNALVLSVSVYEAKNDWLFTPPIALQAGKGYKLSFQVRTNNYDEKLQIYLGNDATVEAMDETPLLDLGIFRHTQYEEKETIFSVASDGNYTIAFYSNSARGADNIYVDDFSLIELTEPDVAITAITTPANVIYTGKHDITATIKNMGGTTLTALDIQYTIGESAPAIHNWTGSLAPGQTAEVTVASQIDMETEGELEIKVNALLTGDINPTDNTATKSINVYAPKTIPYTENFDGVTAPALPELWSIEDYNGSSQWKTTIVAAKSAPNGLGIETNAARDDWAFTPMIRLEAGKKYNISFSYRSRMNNQIENLRVYMGDATTRERMYSTALLELTEIKSNQFQEANQEFTVASTGNYAFGFHALTGRNGVIIDDLSITEVIVPGKPIPYTENFDDVTAPALPEGWTALDLTPDTHTWKTTDNSQHTQSPPNALIVSVSVFEAKNDWLFTPAIAMETGKAYKVSFYIKTNGQNEKLRVYMGNDATVEAMGETPVLDLGEFNHTQYQKKEAIITVPANSNYTIGFHAYSLRNSDNIYIDDFSLVELTEPDIAVENIISPKDIIYTGKHDITATIKNMGGTTLTALDIQYTIGESAPAIHNWTGSLAPGQTAEVTVASQIDMETEGELEIKVNALLTGDINPTDNTATKSINVYAPKTIPYTENFDGVTAPALPELWSIEDYNGSSQWKTTIVAAKSAPNGLGIETNAARDDWAFTPMIRLEAGKNYNLQFFCRSRMNNQVENIRAYIGNAATRAAMGETAILELTEIKSNQFQEANQEFIVDETGNYAIGFHALTGRNGVIIDDLSITEILSDLPDAGIEAITKPDSGIQEGSISPVEVTLKNFSSNITLTSAKVSYKVGEGTPVDQDWTGTLEPGETATVAFPEITFETAGDITITAYTSEPNGETDGNILNDSFSNTISVIPLPAGDAGITAITKPAASIEEGTTSPVEVTLKNFSETVTLNSTTISYIINDRRPVNYEWTGSLEPGETTTVEFPEITFNTVGSLTLAAYTTEPNGKTDANPDNDRFSTVITVTERQLPDAGITAINKPTESIEEGTVSPVEVTLKNFSSNITLTSAKVYYRINEEAPVEQNWTGTLEPGETATVAFPEITFETAGDITITAYTSEPNGEEDDNMKNDGSSANITVTAKPAPLADAGITAITKPGSTITEGEKSVIEVTLKNFSETVTLTSVKVYYAINMGEPIPQEWTGSLAPGATTKVTFPEMTFDMEGTHTIFAATSLPNGMDDANTANDSCDKEITVTGSSIDNIGTEFIRIYPNPFSSLLFIEGSNVERIIITGVSGQHIIDTILNGEKSVDVAKLTEGIYFITVIDKKDNQHIFKMIKNK